MKGKIMDEQKIKELMQAIIQEHNAKLLDKKEFSERVAALVKEVVKESEDNIKQLKDNLKTLNAELLKVRAGVQACNVDQLDKLYKGPWGSVKLAQDFGLYVMASAMGSAKAADLLKSRGYTIQKAQTGADNPTGGLFVPTQIIEGFIMLVAEYGLARRKAVVYPMTTDTATAFKLASGLQVYKVAEGKAPDPQEFRSRLLTLKASEWCVYVPVDRTLDEDAAILLGNVVGELMAMAFAEQEDECLFNGDGTSDTLGIMGITGWLKSLTTPKGLVSGSGNAWGSLTIADHRKCMGVLHPAAWKGEGPTWYCSPQYYFNVMMALADDASGATQTEMILSEAAGRRRFLGLPVEFAPLPSESGSGVIGCVLGNLKRGAMFGDRRQTTIEQSREALFLERQIAILGTERVDINVYGCHDVKTDKKTRAGTIVGLKTT